MNLSKDQLLILLRVYQSKNEFILEDELQKEIGKTLSTSQQLIKELSALDLIEIEENKIHLSPDGYEFIESLTEEKHQKEPLESPISTDLLNSSLETFGKQKFKKYLLFWMLAFAVIIAINITFFPGQPPHQDVFDGLDKEKLMENLHFQLDSIQLHYQDSIDSMNLYK